jgi:hypothetical protein
MKMGAGRKAGIFLMVTACALAPAAATPASHKPHPHDRHTSGRYAHTYVQSLGHSSSGIAHRARKGYVSLVGDPDSGLGFYPLPLKYRIGAWRYHLMHRRPWWDNPVLFAIAADAARYNYWVPANRDYVYGVFNPYDGVGTPFFGGYYDLR